MAWLALCLAAAAQTSLDALDDNGNTRLHRAVSANELRMVRQLLKDGASPHPPPAHFHLFPPFIGSPVIDIWRKACDRVLRN